MIWLLAITLLAHHVPEPGAETALARLLDGHAQARGGKPALESIRSLRVRMRIVEPGFEVQGDYLATREGWMRIDIYSGEERVFTEALSSEGGWQQHGKGAPILPLSDEGEAALRQGVHRNLYGLHQWPALGYELSVQGTPEDGSDGLWHLAVSDPQGGSHTLMLDGKSLQIVGQVEHKALHPDTNPLKQSLETRHTDFRFSDGVMFSWRHDKRDRDSDQWLQTTELLSIELNPEIEPGFLTGQTDRATD